MPPPASEITKLLDLARKGDDSARAELLRVTYDELRLLARGLFAHERRDHTLQPTALVHELQLRLIGREELPGKTRAQFLAYAAKALRHLLVDHARARTREKRGVGRRVAFDEGLLSEPESQVDLVAIDDALEELGEIDERRCRVVELRFFGELTGDEIAEVLGVSPATIDRDWKAARRWLLERLGSN